VSRLRTTLRAGLRLALAALLAIPLGILATLVSLPFWRWFELATDIESVGHSGPAEWCYGVVTLGVFLVLGAVLFLRAGPAPPDA